VLHKVYELEEVAIFISDSFNDDANLFYDFIQRVVYLVVIFEKLI
jgi:hypothetical protein